ncbi:hypothetical protein, partial [Pseudomonas syringae]|uniref:hypothetical protein n=1 Tax=Pseudomonas syringae TaxID=317 RepID=UPI001E4E4916
SWLGMWGSWGAYRILDNCARLNIPNPKTSKTMTAKHASVRAAILKRRRYIKLPLDGTGTRHTQGYKPHRDARKKVYSTAKSSTAHLTPQATRRYFLTK